MSSQQAGSLFRILVRDQRAVESGAAFAVAEAMRSDGNVAVLTDEMAAATVQALVGCDGFAELRADLAHR